MTPSRNELFQSCFRRAQAIVASYRKEAPAAFDPQNTFATIAAVGVTAASAASLATIGYQAAQGNPSTPNLAASSAEVAQAQAAALPEQRLLAAEEQAGGSALNPSYKQSNNADQIRTQLNNRISGLQKQIASAPNSGMQAQLKTKLAGLQSQLANVPQSGPVYLNKQGQVVPASQAMINFQGYGTADIEGALAKQTAANQIALGVKYGVPFAQEAASEAAQADPSGTAARAAEYNLIQQEVNNPQPINPLSGQLQDQIDAQLKAGRGLDPMSEQLMEQQLAQANAARGDNVSAGQVSTAMSQGNQGQSRLQAALQKGMGFVQSGSSPADIEYRRAQQSIANEGAFVGGRTPESQFQSISGAGQGTSPYYPGQTAPGMAGGAASAGSAYGVSAYQDQIRAQMAQANPWLGGISTAMSGLSALGQLP